VLTRDECIVYLGYLKADKHKDALKHGEEAPVCKNCGADLTADLKEAIVPLDCLYMGITCGFPCGRNIKERRVGDSQCMKPTPLKALVS